MEDWKQTATFSDQHVLSLWYVQFENEVQQHDSLLSVVELTSSKLNGPKWGI